MCPAQSRVSGGDQGGDISQETYKDAEGRGSTTLDGSRKLKRREEWAYHRSKDRKLRMCLSVGMFSLWNKL